MKRWLFFNKKTRISLLIIYVATTFFAMNGIVSAADKVVIIPLNSDKASGDATKSDVLLGKTFSSSSGTGLTGARPTAPVGTDGIDYNHTVQYPNPRFSNIGPIFIAGLGVTDLMTGLNWQRNLDSSLHTHSQANTYCEGLDTGGPTIHFNDWRLPTITELQSLIQHNVWAPAIPPAVRINAFSNLESWGDYWSSTLTSAPGVCGEFAGSLIKYINMGYGETKNIISCPGDDLEFHVWCVRGPYYQ